MTVFNSNQIQSQFYLMLRRQQKTITSFYIIFNRQRFRTAPDRPAIRAYFYNLPVAERRRLKWIDYSRRDANESRHCCHVIGVAVSRESFIWAVRHCNWIPNWIVIENLIKRVVNFQGNFTICQRSYNIRNRDGGQRILLKIIKKGDINNIRIHRAQVRQLLRVLNGIRHRYYELFFRRCTAFGVPKNVAQQIFLFLEQIHKQALRVLYRNKEEESDSESQEDSQDQYLPEDQDQSKFESPHSKMTQDSAQREYNRDDSDYPGSGDNRSSC